MELHDRVGPHATGSAPGHAELRVVHRAPSAARNQAERVFLRKLRLAYRRLGELLVLRDRIVVEILDDAREYFRLARRRREAFDLSVVSDLCMLVRSGVTVDPCPLLHRFLVGDAASGKAVGYRILVGFPRPVLFLTAAQPQSAPEIVIDMALVFGLDDLVSDEDDVVGVLDGRCHRPLEAVRGGHDVVGERGGRRFPIVDDDEKVEGLERLVHVLGVRSPCERVRAPRDERLHGIGFAGQNGVPCFRRRHEQLMEHRARYAEHLAEALVDRLEALPRHETVFVVAEELGTRFGRDHFGKLEFGIAQREALLAIGIDDAREPDVLASPHVDVARQDAQHRFRDAGVGAVRPVLVGAAEAPSDIGRAARRIRGNRLHDLRLGQTRDARSPFHRVLRHAIGELVERGDARYRFAVLERDFEFAAELGIHLTIGIVAVLIRAPPEQAVPLRVPYDEVFVEAAFFDLAQSNELLGVLTD